LKFEYFTLENCAKAFGAVVVIDVLRAFSTACYAFNSGADDIIIVGEVKEALALRDKIPGALLFGEVGGYKIDGFDFGNSPREFVNIDLSGMHLIQRTSSGTQGVVRAINGTDLIASSFCCARATAHYLQYSHFEEISFIITGITPDGRGDEDTALADYLSDLLYGRDPDPQPYLARVINSINAEKLRNEPFLCSEDVDLCANLDYFPYAMKITRVEGQLIMRKVALLWK
jgi:2-phosphosulfolactate phosphatase